MISETSVEKDEFDDKSFAAHSVSAASQAFSIDGALNW